MDDKGGEEEIKAYHIFLVARTPFMYQNLYLNLSKCARLNSYGFGNVLCNVFENLMTKPLWFVFLVIFGTL